ncbi:restriction endonuclease subunit M [Betaproteobacteria bacterium]|nr:restriction endonuclease subunit M [Betaproteobacteria bacterium]
MKPFVKWVGGKSQLLTTIQNTYPDGLGVTYKKYAEPFVGGGAVLFDILGKYDLDAVYISDTNRELISVYLALRDSANELITLLSSMQNEYTRLDTADRKAYYYTKRDRFNQLKIDGASTECAATFVFLNKTCFNGLYRVNQKGLFNVPMGAYKNPTICDTENLVEISKHLKNVTIVCDDYKASESFIDDTTFVYFDPPYRPITKTSNFTAYTESLFDDKAQMDLAKFVDTISNKGAKVVASNSDPKNIDAEDDFFDRLYINHYINRVDATRMINCKGEARGKIKELLIRNFGSRL